MKLLLENWKRFINQESKELLAEKLMPFSEAEQSVIKRLSKMFKGWLWQNNKEVFDLIEKNYESIPEEAVGSLDYKIDNSYLAINNLKEDLPEYLNIWNVIGNSLYQNTVRSLVPYELLTEEQTTLSVLWVYRQLNEGKIVDITSIFNSYVVYLEKLNFKPVKTKDGYNFISVSRNYLRDKKIVPTRILEKLYAYPKAYSNIVGDKVTSRPIMLKEYFKWIDFVPADKRDINNISSYDELYTILKEARPLYKEWEQKQEDSDPEAGKKVLLDNDEWQVILLLNKGAACKLGKETKWCTAAPGLEHFHRYSKPNDPIFFILDKSNGERYQFHFGTDQFMDSSNEGL